MSFDSAFRRCSAALLLLSGSGALAFEGLYHFVVSNPDHVAAVERGRALFVPTAALTTASDAALVSPRRGTSREATGTGGAPPSERTGTDGRRR